jgi:hypothetical protein
MPVGELLRRKAQYETARIRGAFFRSRIMHFAKSRALKFVMDS